MKANPKLSRRERQIMDVVYRLGEASAKDVADALPDPPSVTAVRTLLGILQRKGHLKSGKEGRRRVYRPVLSRAKAARSALKNVLDVFFDGSVPDAMTAYFNDPRNELDPEELDRLRALIDAARKDGR